MTDHPTIQLSPGQARAVFELATGEPYDRSDPREHGRSSSIRLSPGDSLGLRSEISAVVAVVIGDGPMGRSDVRYLIGHDGERMRL